MPSIADLRRRCQEMGVDTSGLLEKHEFVSALQAAEEEAAATAAAAAEEEAAAREAEAAAREAAAEAEAAAEEEAEAEALRQAMLMSEESDSVLAELPVSELRSRLAARGISAVGLA